MASLSHYSTVQVFIFCFFIPLIHPSSPTCLSSPGSSQYVLSAQVSSSLSSSHHEHCLRCTCNALSSTVSLQLTTNLWSVLQMIMRKAVNFLGFLSKFTFNQDLNLPSSQESEVSKAVSIVAILNQCLASGIPSISA